MINDKVPWTAIERIIKECGITSRAVVSITSDIADYCLDLASATDKVEMGGFLLGSAKIKDDTLLIQLYDYIQTRNVSSRPDSSFRYDFDHYAECVHKVADGEYDVITHLHTHPCDSWFSPGDLYGMVGDILNLISYYKRLMKEEYISVKRGLLLIQSTKKCPQFLVTGGRIGFLISYGFEKYSLIWLYGNGRYFVQEAISRYESKDDYIRNIDEHVMKAIYAALEEGIVEKIYEDQLEMLETLIKSLHYTIECLDLSEKSQWWW